MSASNGYSSVGGSALDDTTKLLQYPEVGAGVLQLLLTIRQIDQDILQRKEQDTRATLSLSLMRRTQSGTDGGSKAVEEEQFIQNQARKLYDALEALSPNSQDGSSLAFTIEQVYDNENLTFLLGWAVAEQAALDDHIAAIAMEDGRALPASTRCQILVQTREFAGIVGDGDDEQTDMGSADGCERLIWSLVKQCDVDVNRENFAWRNGKNILDKTSCQVLSEHPLFKVLFDEMKDSYYQRGCPKPLLDWSSQWWSNGKPIGDGTDRVECVGCCDSVFSLDCLQASCDHYFCEGCVVTLASICVKDESSFPMKCCKQPIKQADVSPFLDDNLRMLYNAACLEFGTPAEHRVYCPQPKCSAFLGSAAGSSSRGAQQTMTCRRCNIAVCVGCKEGAHPGENCQESKEMKQTRKLAEEQNWRACPKCHAIVEKTEGCNHMVCRCTQEFCYKCGVLWRPRTCTC